MRGGPAGRISARREPEVDRDHALVPNPGGAEVTRSSARTSSAATTSSTQLAATCTAIRDCRSTVVRRRRRATCSAGARPNSTAVSRTRNTANAATLQSTRGSSHDGAPVIFIRPSSTRRPTNSPAAVPSEESTRLSVNSWRTSRAASAPTAERIAISRSRATPRASSRPPRFAHAAVRISRTRAPAIPMASGILLDGGAPVPRLVPPPLLARPPVH